MCPRFNDPEYREKRRALATNKRMLDTPGDSSQAEGQRIGETRRDGSHGDTGPRFPCVRVSAGLGRTRVGTADMETEGREGRRGGRQAGKVMCL